MVQFFESGLSFSFSSRYWKVSQYDLHTYYKGLSGAGLKGVDFVGLYKEDRLVIMEVKNYGYIRTVLPGTKKIVSEIYRKTEDTLIGLDAIRQMLERKWLYRNISFFLPYLPARSHDWPFWFRVSSLLQDEDRISLLLILAGLPKKLQEQIAGQLHRKLEGRVGDIHLFSKDQDVFEGLDIETLDGQ